MKIDRERVRMDERGLLPMIAVLAVIAILFIVMVILWPNIIMGLILCGFGGFLVIRPLIPWPPINYVVAAFLIIFGVVVMGWPEMVGLSVVV